MTDFKYTQKTGVGFFWWVVGFFVCVCQELSQVFLCNKTIFFPPKK